jgi:hypothetical protein
LSCYDFTTKENVWEAQAHALYEASRGYCDPWEILPSEERDFWIGCARRNAATEEIFEHVEDEGLLNRLNTQFDALVERACCDYILNQKLAKNRCIGWTPRRIVRLVRTRSYRRPRRSAFTRAVGDDGDGDSEQDDSDSSYPPSLADNFIFPHNLGLYAVSLVFSTERRRAA